MRALESHRFLLFSTNSGISAVISPDGKIISEIPMDVRGVASATIYPQSQNTFLIRWGYGPVFILIFLMLGYSIISKQSRLLFKRK